MIVVDTSAILAIVLKEPEAEACERAIALAERALISAATLAELLIVADGRHVAELTRKTLQLAMLDVVTVDAVMSENVTECYRTWGKGNHPARLNMGDCFSYATARMNHCPLLFVGNDFSQTDIASAL